MSVIPEELRTKQATTRISVNGFSVHVEGYAWEQDPTEVRGYMRLWYLSTTAESFDALRVVWANLIKGEPASMTFGDDRRGRYCKLWQDGDNSGWKYDPGKLPQATAHQLVLRPGPAFQSSGREDFLMLLPVDADVVYWHTRNMRARLRLPLMPQWGQWLWDRAIELGETRKLETSDNLLAYRAEPNVKLLMEDIKIAGLAGQLPIPDAKSVRNTVK